MIKNKMGASRGALLASILLVLAALGVGHLAGAEVRSPDFRDGIGWEGVARPVVYGAHQEALKQGYFQERSEQGANAHVPASRTVTSQKAQQAARTRVLAGAGMSQRSQVPVITVFWNTLLMALAGGLGAVPFFFVTSMSKEVIGLANAVACGVMLAASFDLLHEGEPYGPLLVVTGILLGMAFIRISKQYLEQYEDVKFESLKGAGARKILLVVGVMAAHAIGEGSGVGVSYSGSRGWSRGILVTLAIGLHNIPEGLAVATVMVARGVSVKQGLWWSILTSLPQTLAAVPSFLFVETFTACLPLAMGFAAGSMIWVVFSELMPDALADVEAGKVATAATLSAAWLEGLRMMLAGLEHQSGTLESPIRADVRAAGPTFAALLPVLLTPIGTAAAVGASYPAQSLVHGVSFGLQLCLGAVLVGRELIWGMEQFGGTLLWALLGAGLAAGLWAFISSELKDSSSQPQENRIMTTADPDPPTELPTWRNSSQPSLKPRVAAVAVVCLAVSVALGVVEGLRVAKASIRHVGDMADIMLPATLPGIIFGLLLGVLSVQFCTLQHSRMLVSSIIGAIPLITAIGSILCYPFGVEDVPFDSVDIIGKGSAAAGGALVYVSVGIVLPMLKTVKYSSPRIGAIIGSCCVLAVYSGLEIMCIFTPYCLR